MTDKKRDLAGPGIGDYNLLAQELPRNYKALLTPMERGRNSYECLFFNVSMG